VLEHDGATVDLDQPVRKRPSPRPADYDAVTPVPMMRIRIVPL